MRCSPPKEQTAARATPWPGPVNLSGKADSGGSPWLEHWFWSWFLMPLEFCFVEP